ncbi:MAG TPA: hypothetical protein VGQ59_12685 [Cyclobacteriaceae bacterium]|jgi:predicted MFS family arabinose efflux permease|nr:hypothetical protein [Cyclobacteriaceae bacterium]
MKLFFVVLLVAFSTKLVAQYQARPSADMIAYQQKLEKYKRMKTGGIVMIVAGSIATIVGISGISNAHYVTNPYTGQRTTNDPQATTGALLVLGGAGLLGGGIPLTIIGSKNVNRYQRKIDGLSLNLNLSPQQQGLVLSYKF